MGATTSPSAGEPAVSDGGQRRTNRAVGIGRGGGIKPTDMSRASTALAAARRQRGAALRAIATGVLSVAELVELAAGDEGRALRPITLHSLLAELGCTARRRSELVALFRRLVHVDAAIPDRRLTLGWICDRRAGCVRASALCEVVLVLGAGDGPRSRPSPRWPYLTDAAELMPPPSSTATTRSARERTEQT